MTSQSLSSNATSSALAFNPNSPSVKRIMQDLAELERNPDPNIHAAPLDDNLFEWHFVLRGPPDTAFSGGLYHGRIILPLEYPFKPPDFILLTPSGRFTVGEKICTSNSSYHPELWGPSWSLRTSLLALVGFFPQKEAHIGALDTSDAERKRLAAESVSWKCPSCNKANKDIITPGWLEAPNHEAKESSPAVNANSNSNNIVDADTGDVVVDAEEDGDGNSSSENQAENQAETVTVMPEVAPPEEPQVRPAPANPRVNDLNDANGGDNSSILGIVQGVLSLLVGLLILRIVRQW